MSELTPRAIVDALDRHIIGQGDAKRAIAVAMRNRWRRKNVADDVRNDITPKNILMIGPTGVGKTELARRMAQLADAPFLKVEATRYTEVGYHGRDVESMVRDLVKVGIGMEQEKAMRKAHSEADTMVEDALLDLLLPATDSAQLSEGTRDKFRRKIRNYELEDKYVEIEVPKHQTGASMDVFTPNNMDDMAEQMQGLFERFSPKQTELKKVTVRDARKLILQRESEKLCDQDAVMQAALESAQQRGIIFIDEIDKVAGTKQKNGADVSREGVQRDLLPIVEGTQINTKWGMVSTDNILFVASGAFHVSKPSDLIPEFQGRFPIRVELSRLQREDFVNILTKPRNALVKQYQALLSTEGVELEFAPEALEKLGEMAEKANHDMEDIGARRLHTLLERLLADIAFEASETPGPYHVTVDMVNEALGSLLKNEDLSKYVL